MNTQNTDFLNGIMGAMDAETAPKLPEFIPADAPFDEAQRTFLNGLFAGLHVITSASRAGTAQEPAKTALNILYGSQTGTAEAVCKDLKKFAATQGFDGSIEELNAVDPADLAAMNHLLIVTSTYGEGDPPDNATAFCEKLMAVDSPALPATLNYSVLGLGDTSYAHFNRAARTIDARLAELGATRVAEIVPCDVDYDDDYAIWRGGVFEAEAFKSAGGAPSAPAAEGASDRPEFDKSHPFLATLLRSECLSGDASAKRVNHIEISLAGGGQDLDYQVGDALGVWAPNDMAEVDAILAAAGFSGAEVVTLKSGQTSLRHALFKLCDLQVIPPSTAENWGRVHVAEDHLIDYVMGGIADLTPQGLVDGLRSAQPRLYSISSSPKKHPGEVHLTVGEVHYDRNDIARNGVASNFLGGRLQAGGSLGVYIQKAGHFYLPEDDATPLIMIGPGTGIAPFRAFLEEREMRGASGKNWLFFGDQHASCDFLYEETLSAWRDTGLLTKLDLAWSRDGAQKVYVQHLIEANGAEFFAWLQDGAAIYICGDATRMAADVEAAILNVIAAHGPSDVEAPAYLEGLKSSHRYQRDVY